MLVLLIQLVGAQSTSDNLSGGSLTLNIVYASVALIAGVILSISLACYCGKSTPTYPVKNQLSTLTASDIALQYDQQQDVQISTRLKTGTFAGRASTQNGLDYSATTMMGNNTTLNTQGKTLALPGFLMLIKDLDFSLSDQFNEGGAGTIFHGVLSNPTALARMKGDTKCVIKVMKPLEDANLDESNALFNNEISITWLLNDCPNIIQLVGYCPQPPMILLKDYTLGSLEDIIHKDKRSIGLVPDNQWTPKFILRMMRDIAAGLADMHENGLVHNDLKPGNVLLDKLADGTLVAIVCDFGVTSIIDENLLRVKAYKISRVKGASLVYAPPEVLKDFQDNTDTVEKSSPEFVKAGDIYSYSMLAYELLYRRIPWWDEDDLEVIAKSVIKGRRPQLPKSLYERKKKDRALDLILTTMEKCYHNDPLQRTPFADIVDQINEFLGAPKRKKTTTDLVLRKKMVDTAKTSTTQDQFRQTPSLRNAQSSSSSGSQNFQQRAPSSSNQGNGRSKSNEVFKSKPTSQAQILSTSQAQQQPPYQQAQYQPQGFQPILPPPDDTVLLDRTATETKWVGQ